MDSPGPKNRRMKSDKIFGPSNKNSCQKSKKRSKNGHFLTPLAGPPRTPVFQKGVKPRVLKKGGGPRKENGNKNRACSDFWTYRLKAKNRVFSLFFAKKPEKSLRPEWHRHSVVVFGQKQAKKGGEALQNARHFVTRGALAARYKRTP